MSIRIPQIILGDITKEYISIKPIDYCYVKDIGKYIVMYNFIYFNITKIFESNIPYYISDGLTNKLRANVLLPFMCINELGINEFKTYSMHVYNKNINNITNYLYAVKKNKDPEYIKMLKNIMIDTIHSDDFIDIEYDNLHKMSDEQFLKLKQFIINELRTEIKENPILDSIINKNEISSIFNVSETCPVIINMFNSYGNIDLLMKYKVCKNIDTSKLHQEIFGTLRPTGTGLTSFFKRIENILDFVLCISSYKFTEEYKYKNYKYYVPLSHQEKTYIDDITEKICDDHICDSEDEKIYDKIINLLRILNKNVISICDISYLEVPEIKLNEKIYDKYSYNSEFVIPNICNKEFKISDIAIKNYDSYYNISSHFYNLFIHKYKSITIPNDYINKILKEDTSCNSKKDLNILIDDWGAVCVKKQVQGGGDNIYYKYLKYMNKYKKLIYQ